ncbi:MAG: hypothetical protein V4682_02430 [Patescibacteria group bacterium]
MTATSQSTTVPASSNNKEDPVVRAEKALFGPKKTSHRPCVDAAIYALLACAESGGPNHQRAWSLLQRAFNQNQILAKSAWKRYGELKRNPPRMRRERTPEEREQQRRRRDANRLGRAQDNRARLKN